MSGDCRPDCPPARQFSLTDNSPAEELHAVALVAQDAAGNRSLLWQHVSPPVPDDGAAKITAALEHGATRISVGSRYAIRGRLVGRAGTPIRAGQVELVAISRTADAVPQRAAIVVTDDAGRWRVAGLRAADGSRTYVARHLDDTGEATSSPPVRATVAVHLSARIRRTAAVRTVAGRVTAPAASGRPIRLLLATRQRDGWRTVRSTRSSVNRRYALRVPGRVRSRLAVFVSPSPDLPYAPAGRVVDLARP